jgi:hypothetical protein
LFWLLFEFTGFPIIIIASVYMYRAFHNKKFFRVVTYPFIDFLRTLSFCSGQLYELIKRT